MIVLSFIYTRVMKSLNEDLKTGQFKQIYLLYGEESYLKKQYKGTACQSDDSGR